MFDVGFSELLVIFIIALVVLGPERLPGLAKQAGKWIGRARAMARQFRDQLEEEINLETPERSSKPVPSAADEPAATTPENRIHDSPYGSSYYDEESSEELGAPPDSFMYEEDPEIGAIPPLDGDSAGPAGRVEAAAAAHPEQPSAGTPPPAHAHAGPVSAAAEPEHERRA